MLSAPQTSTSWGFLFKDGASDAYLDGEEDWDIDSVSLRDLAPAMTDEVALQDPVAFPTHFKMLALPAIPKTKRDVGSLLDISAPREVWAFSKTERLRVATYIEAEMKEERDEQGLYRYQTLAKRHEELRTAYNEARAAVSSA